MTKGLCCNIIDIFTQDDLHFCLSINAIYFFIFQSGYGLLTQLAPVLMLIFLSLMGSFLVPDSPFSLQHSV